MGTQEKAVAEAESNAAIDAFFWVLIVCLVLFGIGHYAWVSRIGL
jgi:hypothetical protein